MTTLGHGSAAWALGVVVRQHFVLAKDSSSPVLLLLLVGLCRLILFIARACGVELSGWVRCRCLKDVVHCFTCEGCVGRHYRAVVQTLPIFC
ncbi:hypothetical protein CC79DRAFT_525918 [Sarocladium strictum]